MGVCVGVLVLVHGQPPVLLVAGCSVVGEDQHLLHSTAQHCTARNLHVVFFGAWGSQGKSLHMASSAM